VRNYTIGNIILNFVAVSY